MSDRRILSIGVTPSQRAVAALVTLLLVVSVCASACASAPDGNDPRPGGAGANVSDSDWPESVSPDLPTDDQSDPDQNPAVDSEPDVAPERFVPSGPVGDAEAYEQLIDQLAQELPAHLRDHVPWPDIGNPDPVVAQLAIFELWVWVTANHPAPDLARVMAVEASPSRDTVVEIFSRLRTENLLMVRPADPYRAFDHRAVTLESAGLPLWLTYDVPADAVVLYYQDQSGPAEFHDADTLEVLDRKPAIEARQWLSIMVPTEVGWQLYRDELIEPFDHELEVPDVGPPAPGTDSRKPQL